jgi:hypothetical protein
VLECNIRHFSCICEKDTNTHRRITTAHGVLLTKCSNRESFGLCAIVLSPRCETKLFEHSVKFGLKMRPFKKEKHFRGAISLAVTWQCDSKTSPLRLFLPAWCSERYILCHSWYNCQSITENGRLTGLQVINKNVSTINASIQAPKVDSQKNVMLRTSRDGGACGLGCPKMR